MINNIVIIGMGPRGISVLDALSNAGRCRTKGMEIHVFEPRVPGCGCHGADQPKYLLTNTVCSQITAFAPIQEQSRSPMGRPSLYEWARLTGQQIEIHGHVRHVQENDYLPRAILGRYLAWAYTYIVRNIKPYIDVKLHPEKAIAVTDTCQGRFHVRGQRGTGVEVDGVILCTGHSSATPDRATSDSIQYDVLPQDGEVGENGRKANIGLEGMGLTALDLLGAATVGRGGRFLRSAGKLTYVPSGYEPGSLCFSRTGVPPVARAQNQKGAHWSYEPHFATVASIESIRRLKLLQEGCGTRLDFNRDILPLIEAEMEFIYYKTLARRRHGFEAAEKITRCYLSNGNHSKEIRAFITELPDSLRWSLQAQANPLPRNIATDADCYRAWLISQMHHDVEEALAGNVDSPVKAACDVLRDIRDSIRIAVEDCGLTPESHHAFINNFLPMMNHLSVGPPLHKIEELRALIEAEIVDVGTGPVKSVSRNGDSGLVTVTGLAGSREITKLVRARLALHLHVTEDGGVIGSLVASGHARAFRNGAYEPGGLDVTDHNRLIAANGSTHARIWAIGPAVEGPRFYTYVLGRPGDTGASFRDASRCVADILRCM